MEKQNIETYCKHPENRILIITSSVNVPFYVPTQTVDSSHAASTGCKSIRTCSVRSANPSNDPHMSRRMWIYIIPIFICCFWHDYTLKMRVTRKCDSIHVHVIFLLSRFYLAFVLDLVLWLLLVRKACERSCPVREIQISVYTSRAFKRNFLLLVWAVNNLCLVWFALLRR